MALIGFARVSSVGQELTTQVNALEDHGCERIFHGKQSGVSKENALKLREMLEFVRDKDVVVVTKLDRLGRSLKTILEVIQTITEKGATFKTLDGAINTTNDSPFATAQLSLIGTFAQLERDLIAQRTTEGRSEAKKRGVRFGRRPALSDEQKKSVLKKLSNGKSVYGLAKEFNVSRQTIMRIRETVTMR